MNQQILMDEKILFYVYGHMSVPTTWRRTNLDNANSLYFIHGGVGGFEVSGCKYNFEAGNFYLLPGKSKVKVWTDAENPIVHTYCDFEMFPAIIFSNVFSKSLDDDPMFEIAKDLFVAGGKLCAKNREKGLFVIAKEKEQFFIGAVKYIIHRLMENGSNHIVKDRAILAVIEYMHNHIAEKISIETLASLVYMSEGAFIKRFKKVMGETPYSFLRNIRLDMAYYLKEQGNTLEMIAEKVGYSDGVALLHAMKGKHK